MSDADLCPVCGASWRCEHAGEADSPTNLYTADAMPPPPEETGEAVELLQRAAAMERFAANITSVFQQRDGG